MSPEHNEAAQLSHHISFAAALSQHIGFQLHRDAEGCI